MKIIVGLLSLLLTGSVQSNDINWAPELNGAWYNVDTPGQGLFVDHNLENNIFFMGWFTYPTTNDPSQPQQKWLTLQGTFEGAVADLKIYDTSGGEFNKNTETTTEPIGQATFTLLACNQARLDFSMDFDNQTISDQIEFIKILPLSDEACQALLEANYPKTINNTEIIAITHVSIATMNGSEILHNQTLIIEDQLIQAIGPTDQMTLPEDAIVIRAKNKFIMPGINDMHTHLASSISEFMGTHVRDIRWNTPTRINETTESRDSQLMLYLAKGVTSILNTGDFGEPMPQWASMVQSGELIGPNIYSSHYVRGNRPDCQHGPPHTVANNVDEARDLMQRAKDSGYDFLKVYRCAPEESVLTVLAEGPALNLPTIGHFPDDISARATITNGMKGVAHMMSIPQSDVLPNGNLNLLPSVSDFLVEHDFTVITTMLIYELIAQVWGNNTDGAAAYWADPENVYMHPTTARLNLRKLRGGFYGEVGTSNEGILAEVDKMREMTLYFHNRGVNLLLGTDSPGLLGVAGFSAHDEMRAMKRAGLSTPDILKIATVNGAQFIMNSKPGATPFGVVAEGYRADLLLLNINPLENLEFEDQIAAVMARGSWYSQAYFNEQLATIASNYQTTP